jgi:hypothetical protein
MLHMRGERLMRGYDWNGGQYVTRFTPTGESRPSQFPCVVCHEPIDGPGSEYIDVAILDSRGVIIFKTQEPIRRHFLNDRHAVTLLTIDYKPTPFVKAF